MNFFNKIFSGLVISLLVYGCGSYFEPADKEIMYVGTFDERNSQGIYVFEFERDSVQFKLLQTFPDQKSPSWLEIHPSGKYLYAVTRAFSIKGKEWGTVSAFSIDTLSGMLKLINEQSSYGRGPCHISFDNTGRFVFISNYSDGNLVVYAVNDNGSISDSIQLIQHTGKGLNPQRQDGPHVHSSLVSPDNRFLYVADLGIDKIMIYQLDKKGGKLTTTTGKYIKVGPGSGPRHMAMSGDGRYVYLAEELSSTTDVFARDAVSGYLTEIQRISCIPAHYTGENTSADIHTAINGRYLYVSNRGHNSLAEYSVDTDGLLTLIGFQSTNGDRPRNFLVDPRGNFLFVANRNSDNINVFEINKETGMLNYSGVSVKVPGAVCIKMIKL